MKTLDEALNLLQGVLALPESQRPEALVREDCVVAVHALPHGLGEDDDLTMRQPSFVSSRMTCLLLSIS